MVPSLAATGGEWSHCEGDQNQETGETSGGWIQVNMLTAYRAADAPVLGNQDAGEKWATCQRSQTYQETNWSRNSCMKYSKGTSCWAFGKSIWLKLDCIGLRTDQFSISIITQRHLCHERTVYQTTMSSGLRWRVFYSDQNLTRRQCLTSPL